MPRRRGSLCPAAPYPAAGVYNYPFIIALLCALSSLPLPMGEVALRGPRKAKLCGEKAEQRRE